MARLSLLPFFFTALLTGWAALAQEVESEAVSLVRQPRSHRQRKLCRKYGICEHGGGFGGGYGGQQGYQGYQGYPPINIGISQSQSSANAAGGGYSNGYYPTNYQYNQGYGGYPSRPSYFGNGQGAYNNQFNGNYHGGGGFPQGGGYQNGGGYPLGGGIGGYGFQGPFGNFFDEADNNVSSNSNAQIDDNEYNGPGYDDRNSQGASNVQDRESYASAGSFAYAGRKAS